MNRRANSLSRLNHQMRDASMTEKLVAQATNRHVPWTSLLSLGLYIV